MSFCLLRNQSGILNWRGLEMTTMRDSRSAADSSPARLFTSTSAFLQARMAKRRPTPRMAVMAYGIFCLPSTFVFTIRRMCWKSSDIMSDLHRVQTPFLVSTPTHRRSTRGSGMCCADEALV
jgi:hypothetical protein